MQNCIRTQSYGQKQISTRNRTTMNVEVEFGWAEPQLDEILFLFFP